MKVEYLIVFKTEDHVCNSVRSFMNLIGTDDLIEVKSSSVIKYNSDEFEYRVGSGEIIDKTQKFYQLEISCAVDQNAENLNELVRRIRKLVIKFGGEINVLWDDFGLANAAKAYPEICRVENLLRKLISKFMLTNIGTVWENKTIPSEVKKAVDTNKRSRDSLLHKVDFIHLADFLFKPYQTKPQSELVDKISKSQDISDLNLEDLKSFLPESNWKRYFNKVVGCDDGFLSKRLQQLYELRCLVAHSNYLTRKDLDDVFLLVNEIEEQLSTALDKIDNIVVPAEEKETVVENAAANINRAVGEYIDHWKSVESQINHLYTRIVGDSTHLPIIRKVKNLIEKEELTHEFLYDLLPLLEFRNVLVHADLYTHGVNDQKIQWYSSLMMDFQIKHILFTEPFFVSDSGIVHDDI